MIDSFLYTQPLPSQRRNAYKQSNGNCPSGIIDSTPVSRSYYIYIFARIRENISWVSTDYSLGGRYELSIACLEDISGLTARESTTWRCKGGGGAGQQQKPPSAISEAKWIFILSTRARGIGASPAHLRACVCVRCARGP